MRIKLELEMCDLGPYRLVFLEASIREKRSFVQPLFESVKLDKNTRSGPLEKESGKEYFISTQTTRASSGNGRPDPSLPRYKSYNLGGSGMDWTGQDSLMIAIGKKSFQISMSSDHAETTDVLFPLLPSFPFDL